MACCAVLLWASCEERLIETPKQSVLSRTAGNLRDLVEAQEDVRSRRVQDKDSDQQGEYVSIDVLIAERVYMKKPWQQIGPNTFEDLGTGGYTIRLFLPDDIDMREAHWCAAAWPTDPGSSRLRKSFLILEGPKAVLYETDDLKGAVSLSDIYHGSPYASGIRTDHWKVSKYALVGGQDR